jgi:hypothetical protein
VETLNGLTAIWTLSSLRARPPGIESSLRTAEANAKSLIQMGLPDYPSWTDDAEALNLLRTIPLGSATLYRQFLVQQVAPYLNPGINQTDSADLIAIATEQCPWLEDKLHPHALKEWFVRLPGTNQDELVAAMPSACTQTAELGQLIAQNGYGQQDNTAVTEFTQRINQSADISRIADWWDNVPALSLTVIGQVIGFVNARRYVQFQGAQTVGEFLALRETQQ